jgi:hypothetical protein
MDHDMQKINCAKKVQVTSLWCVVWSNASFEEQTFQQTGTQDLKGE